MIKYTSVDLGKEVCLRLSGVESNLASTRKLSKTKKRVSTPYHGFLSVQAGVLDKMGLTVLLFLVPANFNSYGAGSCSHVSVSLPQHLRRLRNLSLWL